VITIALNGKATEIRGSATVSALIESLNISPKQVAVAVNGEVIARDSWPGAVLLESDVVEIVRAVGGG